MEKLLNLKLPEHSYLIGYVQTDGHLQSSTRNRGKLTIEISYKDKDILEKLRKIIPVNSTVYTRVRDTNFSKSYTSTTLNVFDLKFRNEIVDNGVPYGKKSNIITPPNCIYSKIDYWRGIIDGDGSLGITATNLPFISLVTASENLYLAYKEWLHSIDINISSKRNNRDKIYNIMITREKAQKIVQILYYKNCICLNRKMQSAKKVLLWKRPENMKFLPKQPNWTKEELLVLKNNNVNECMKLLPHRTINAIKIKKQRCYAQKKDKSF